MLFKIPKTKEITMLAYAFTNYIYKNIYHTHTQMCVYIYLPFQEIWRASSGIPHPVRNTLMIDPYCFNLYNFNNKCQIITESKFRFEMSVCMGMWITVTIFSEQIIYMYRLTKIFFSDMHLIIWNVFWWYDKTITFSDKWIIFIRKL